jgi:hypothetical protein
MGKDEQAAVDHHGRRPASLRDLLLQVPPGHADPFELPSVAEADVNRGGRRYFRISWPDVDLYCYECKGERCFTATDYTDDRIEPRKRVKAFVDYGCRNCRRGRKTYALQIVAAALPSDDPRAQSLAGKVLKLGETPPFGPPLPARVLRLVQPDKDLLVQGWRAERQGLGIGAFAYYRRVVERQKDRLFDEVIRVARKKSADAVLIGDLERAKTAPSFERAIEEIEPAVPESLMLGHHNPFKLLHRALSLGVHNDSDEECLGLATAIRTVLIELSDEAAQALASTAELDAAVSLLMDKSRAGRARRKGARKGPAASRGSVT